MKAYWGNSGIAPCILYLGTRSEWSASRPGCFTPQGNRTWYPFDRSLGGPQSRSVRCSEEKISQSLHGLIQSAAQRYTTELFQLMHVHLSTFWTTSRISTEEGTQFARNFVHGNFVLVRIDPLS
jgi:hypothetical protein